MLSVTAGAACAWAIVADSAGTPIIAIMSNVAENNFLMPEYNTPDTRFYSRQSNAIFLGFRCEAIDFG